MGVGMEIGKILTVSYLYRQWRKLNRFTRTLYILIVAVLVFLTSIEVMGFLSQTHMSVSRDLRITEKALYALNNEAAILREQISIMDKTLAGLPISHVSRRINERKASGYNKKQARLLETSKQQAQFKAKIIKEREYTGPIFSVAQIMNINETDAIGMFIFLLVLVLEPLSIGLTVAANAVWMTPTTTLEVKPQKNTSTKELKAICEKYNISISQLASITGRKKQTTCKDWLNGKATVPEKALRTVQAWIKKQNFETALDKKVITITKN